jgi:hypothetical protein
LLFFTFTDYPLVQPSRKDDINQELKRAILQTDPILERRAALIAILVSGGVRSVLPVSLEDQAKYHNRISSICSATPEVASISAASRLADQTYSSIRIGNSAFDRGGCGGGGCGG